MPQPLHFVRRDADSNILILCMSNIYTVFELTKNISYNIHMKFIFQVFQEQESFMLKLP